MNIALCTKTVLGMASAMAAAVSAAARRRARAIRANFAEMPETL